MFNIQIIKYATISFFRDYILKNINRNQVNIGFIICFKLNKLLIIWIVSLLSLGLSKIYAQLPVENYFQVDKNYVVIDSTLFDFEKAPLDSVIKYESEARAFSKTLNPIKDKYKAASAYHYVLQANFTLKRQDSALVYLYKALELPEAKTSKGAINIYLELYRIHRFAENPIGQLELLKPLKDLGAKYDYYKNTEPKSLRKMNGEILLRAGFYKEARDFYTQNLIPDSLALDPLKYAIVCSDLANIYETFDINDSVIKYREMALKMVQSDRPNPYAKNYKPYIRDYILLQNLWYKEDYSQKSLKFAQDFLHEAITKQGGEAHSAFLAYHFIANYFFKTKDYKQALAYIDKGIDLGKDKMTLNKLEDVFTLKIRILDKLNKEDLASEALKEFKQIKNEKFQKNRNLDLAKYQVNQISQDKEKAEILAIKNKSKYIKTIYITILLGIILIIIVIAFYVTRKKNFKIKSTQQEVSKKLKEKEFLLRELNHRVKNNLALILSLVKFQSDEVEDTTHKQKFKNLEQRIKTIAVAHEQFLYNQDNLGEYYDLKQYLLKIINGLKSISSRKVKLNLVVSDTMLNIDTALPIGILINELISNSLEHAITKNQLDIEINIFEVKNQINLIYKDSGTEFKIAKNKNSLGLNIIESMVEQLFGSLNREYSTYHITLKPKNQDKKSADN